MDSFRIDRIAVPGKPGRFSLPWYGVALPVLALLSLFLFMWMRKRKRDSEEELSQEGDGTVSADSASESGGSSGGDFNF